MSLPGPTDKLLNSLALLGLPGKTRSIIGPPQHIKTEWDPKLSFCPESQCVHDQQERCRILASAGIIKVIAREHWAPVIQNLYELAGGDLAGHKVFRHIGYPITGHGSLDLGGRAVEYDLSFDTNAKLTTVFFELPRIEPARS